MKFAPFVYKKIHRAKLVTKTVAIIFCLQVQSSSGEGHIETFRRAHHEEINLVERHGPKTRLIFCWLFLPNALL